MFYYEFIEFCLIQSIIKHEGEGAGLFYRYVDRS